MAEFDIIQTTKRKVAREEIETAIRLMFRSKSYIAVNILAWAAVDILRALAEVAGKETLREKLAKSIRPDKLKFWRNLERESYTFFKHADKDTFKDLSFRPEGTAFVLAYAVADYGTVYSQNTLLMRLYLAWFMSRYPDVFNSGIEGQADYFRETFKFVEGQSFDASLNAAGEFFRDFEHEYEDLLELVPLEARGGLEE